MILVEYFDLSPVRSFGFMNFLWTDFCGQVNGYQPVCMWIEHCGELIPKELFAIWCRVEKENVFINHMN